MATPTANLNKLPSVKAAAEAGVAKVRYVWASLRLVLAGIFLWAFLDKTFGLGFATQPQNAWIHGGSPTTGFLKFGADGWFASAFQALAGSVVVDWVFMLGLLGIGLALLLGIGMRLAAASGATMMALMWLASLPGETNPLLDDHVVYALVLVALAMANAGRTLGLGGAWSRLEVVREHPVLE